MRLFSCGQFVSRIDSMQRVRNRKERERMGNRVKIPGGCNHIKGKDLVFAGMVIHNPKVGGSIPPPATNNLLLLNIYKRPASFHLERGRVQFVSTTNSRERIRNWSEW
jgi:hypothetical protein